MDPDYQPREEVEKVSAPTFTKNIRSTINSQQVESLINLFRQNTADNKELQTSFLAELDKIMDKAGIGGKTDNSNFRTRLGSLSPKDYQYLYNWLVELEENNK